MELGLVTELSEPRDQLLDPDLGRTALEVVGAEVVVRGAVLEHVIDRRRERGGNGADCFLRRAPAAEPMELGTVVAVLLALGRPGPSMVLSQGEPRRRRTGLRLPWAFSPRA